MLFQFLQAIQDYVLGTDPLGSVQNFFGMLMRIVGAVGTFVCIGVAGYQFFAKGDLKNGFKWVGFGLLAATLYLAGYSMITEITGNLPV